MSSYKIAIGEVLYVSKLRKWYEINITPLVEDNTVFLKLKGGRSPVACIVNKRIRLSKVKNPDTKIELIKNKFWELYIRKDIDIIDVIGVKLKAEELIGECNKYNLSKSKSKEFSHHTGQNGILKSKTISVCYENPKIEMV